MSQTAVRLLSLLSLLQVKRAWSGSELAARLGVSTRTVRTDMERLRELGYAVEGTRGGDGGYALGSGGSAIPPLLLDAEEAIAVAVGLRTGVSCIIGGMEETSIRALAKLERTLPGPLRSRVRNLNRYTVPLASTMPMPEVEPATLTQLAGLCDQRERVRFTHTGDPAEIDAGQASTTEHEVEPYRLVNQRHRWYLLGYDIATEDWAVFRVDRMQLRTPNGPRFPSRELPDSDVARYVARRAPENVWRHRATILLHAPAAAVSGRVMPAEGCVQSVDETTSRLTIGAETLTAIALVLGRLQVDFTVEEPEELVTVVREFGERYRRATVG
ncbi:MAG: helix-turn-helix transcriptional regulator [Propionibacteriaceae bacterium]